MNSTLLGASLSLYFLASVLYLANLHIKSPRMAIYGTVAASIGFALQSSRLVYQTFTLGSPFATPPEAMFFLSWAIIATYLVTLIWFKLPAVGALAMPLSVIALALAYRFRGNDGETFIQSGWISLHVYAIIISLALFAIAFCCAIFFLVQNWLLKNKRLTVMFRKLPPLQTIDNLAYHLAAIGFPMLTLGIITGVVGVKQNIVHLGNLKIRLIVAGLTWAIYALYLLSRRTAHWRGKKSNGILIFGTVAIALTVGLHHFV